MIHGGDIYSYGKDKEEILVDFSSNINPLGQPKGLYDEIYKSLKKLNRYPDIKYRDLKYNISKYLNVDIDSIILGNGAMEIIDLSIRLANRIVILNPSFMEYNLRANVNEKEVLNLYYNKNFEIDFEDLNINLKEGDGLILGNPNNPNGLRIMEEDLIKIYKLVLERNAHLILDEAFFEFSPKDYDSIELFKENNFKAVTIIRAATKFFGLPGIRLGYGVMDKNNLDLVNRMILPWSINSIAEIAASYIFKDEDYINESREYVDIERRFLFESLNRFKYLKAFSSHSNFILIKLLKYDEDYIFEELFKKNIIIRKCSNFIGLDKSYIRIAIRSREDNIKLLNALKEVID